MYLRNLFHNSETDSIKRSLNSNIFLKFQNIFLIVLTDNISAFNSELVLDETNMLSNNSFIRV